MALACTPTAPPSESPTPSATASKPARQEESKPLLPMPRGKPVSFDRQLERVEKIRELKAKRPVQGLALSTEELLGHVQRSFELELPDHALSASEDALVGLGVVPRDFDYEQTMLSLLSSSLAGLYDPRLEAMFVHEDLSGDELEAALLHELVHALQDQHYHLDGITKWQLDGTDRSSALSCLAEGDATSATWDGMLEASGRNALDVPDGVILAQMTPQVRADDPIPAVIRRSLVAPYADGVIFVHQIRERGGWAAVDTVWTQPPRSTEQILHIDKYFAQEAPVQVPILPAPDDSWDLRMTDVWGEQSLRLIFEEWTTGPQAKQRAAGWGGDRLAVYQRGQQRAVAWHLIADDAEAAQTYFDTVALALEEAVSLENEALETGQRAGVSARVRCQERAWGPFLVTQHDTSVRILLGPFLRGKELGEGPPADCKDSLNWWEHTLTPRVPTPR